MSGHLFKEIDKHLFEHLQRLCELETQQGHDKERITYVNQLVIDLEKKLTNRLNIQNDSMQALFTRLEKLERKSILPTERDLTKIIREQLPNHDVEVRFVGCGGDGINPKLKYMSAKEAMRHLFAGYKISRKSLEWRDEYMKLGDEYSFSLDVDDLQANDWYIVE